MRYAETVHREPAALDRRDPHAVPRLTRRTEIRAAGAANVLLGAWLIVSPFVLGYAPGDPALHDALAGAAVAVLAVSRLTAGWWRPALSWVNAFIGMWLVGAAFWRAESATASWNEALTGALVAALASVSAWATTAARVDEPARHPGARREPAGR